MLITALATAHSGNNHRRIFLAFWLAAGILIFLTWWYAFALIRESRSRELALAGRDLANLTRFSQEHVTRTLRSADQVIRFVTSRYLNIGDRLNLKDLTAKGVIDAEIFNQVGIINAQGIYALANLPITERLDLSDREHFKVHATADTNALFVSKPVLGRASGKQSIQLSRRINRPNGEFAGVVVVSIDPGYFTRFYSELNLGEEGITALYDLHGVALALRFGANDQIGTQAQAAPMFARIASGKADGTYILRSEVDGVERMYHYRKIPEYPLVVLAGLDTPYLLAGHSRDWKALWLQAALVSLLIVALTFALTRCLRQIRKNMAARQLAQRQIHDRTEQLNAIFALSPDGFVAFDKQRRIQFVSPAFARMMSLGTLRLEGFDEHDFSAWLANCCTSGTPFTGIAFLRSQVTAGKPDANELIEISNNGKRILQIGLRCSETSTVSQILYFRDVTAETEVDQMKSDFLSTAAHELRTPMASIFGFSEVLLTTEIDATERQEFLTIIYEQSKLMANILDEFLDLARIEARRGKDFRYTRVCLQELATNIVKAFKQPNDRALPELVMPTQPLYVMADAGKLRQVILNMLSNAYKYSPEGGPVVCQIAAQGDETGQVCIHISDQGIGMTPEQLGRVCERFYRVDSSGKIPGTGLGMSIAKEIIELHRGNLVMVSNFGQGTQVTMCLPASEPSSDCNVQQEQMPRASENKPKQNFLLP